MNNIYIKSIYIKELRHLKDISINIDNNEKKNLIITGRNGSGKTTLLEAIKSYLRFFESTDTPLEYRKDASKKLYSLQNELKQIEANTTLSLEDKKIKINEIKKPINLSKSWIESYGNWIDLDISMVELIQNAYRNGEIIFSYFDAKRNSNVTIPTGVEKVTLNEKYPIDAKPSANFLKYLVDLKTQQSFAKNEGDFDESNKIELWFKKFENALRDIMDSPNLSLKFDYKNYNFTINEEGKIPYGFNELSDGYSAILDIIIDLIMRMENKASRAYDLEGIVLIDEIEAHLHISLQKKILPFLTKLFPNVQFIVTTHSPFILNSIENAVIYDLENKTNVKDLTAYSYEGIVEEYFNIDQYSQSIKDKLNRYKKLIFKDNITKEEAAEIEDLRKYLAEVSEEEAPELYAEFMDLEIHRELM